MNLRRNAQAFLFFEVSMAKPKYHRVIIKLSGEALAGANGTGIDHDKLAKVVDQIVEVEKMGVQVGVVIGGGNFWRGRQADSKMNRSTADHMGMLATVMNALCLKDAFTAAGVRVQVHCSVDMRPFAAKFDRDQAMKALSDGEPVIFAGGTGSPYFTTDTTASLRALETRCEAVMKATKVNGIYTADPVKHPEAVKFDRLSFSEALAGRYGVMDSAAFSLCADNGLHIIVFNFSEPGALVKILSGDCSVGTVVS